MKKIYYSFLVGLTLFGSNGKTEVWTSKPVHIERPEELPDSRLESYNIGVNDLNGLLNHYSSYYIKFDDRIRQFVSTGKINEAIDADINFEHYAILEYPGSKSVSRTSLTNEIVNLRREPNGQTLKASIPKDTLVLVARECNDWVFVGVRIPLSSNSNTLKDVVTGWVKQNSLAPSPKNIHINNFKKLSEEQIKAHEKLIRKSWLDQERENDRQKVLLDKAEEIQKELKKISPNCPNDFTDVEMEGFVTWEKYSNARHQLYLKCSKVVVQAQNPKISSVRLVKDKCNCFKIDQEEISNFEMKRENESFEFHSSSPQEGCELGRKFVFCKIPGPCYNNDPTHECSLNIYTDLICPRSCLQWKLN